MDSVEFILGEDREVRFVVHAAETDVFSIKSATWELARGDELEAKGGCLVDGSTVRAQIQPLVKAFYRLEITLAIGNETIKKRIRLVVI
jgi:hypothetical protein